jgi:hypothetical protein
MRKSLEAREVVSGRWLRLREGLRETWGGGEGFKVMVDDFKC